MRTVKALCMALVLILAVSPALAEGEDKVVDIFADDYNIFGQEVPHDVVIDPYEQYDFIDEDVTEAIRESLEIANKMENILLVGIDARPGEKTGRTDTMILVTLDTKNNVIKLTSFMRDLYVEIPGRSSNRMNAAYVYGGPELLMKTIKQNFGIDVDVYAAVNFTMLADIIDQIGGLDLHVESKYYMERINAVIREDNKVLGIAQKTGLLTEWGDVHMTGRQAQAYARYRYGTKDGDFGRTARQREIIAKIFEKVSSMSMLDIIALASANMDKVYTNLTLENIITLIPAVIAMKSATIEELRIPVNNGYSSKKISGMAVLVPNRTKTKEAISEFLTK